MSTLYQAEVTSEIEGNTHTYKTVPILSRARTYEQGAHYAKIIGMISARDGILVDKITIKIVECK